MSGPRGTGWDMSCKDKKRRFKKLRERQGDRCAVCGGPMCFECPGVCLAYRTIDHIKPMEHGGRHRTSNLQLAHFACNQRRAGHQRVGRLANVCDLSRELFGELLT